VATLVSERQPAGSYQVEWDASSMASGVYYYVLSDKTNIRIKKMTLLK
jgi:hypothetical protein